MELIRKTTSDLIRKCKAMVDEEEMAAAAAASAAGEEYINSADPSVLRFLIAAREEVDSTQVGALKGAAEGEKEGLGAAFSIIIGPPLPTVLFSASGRLPY